MELYQILSPEQISQKARALFEEERRTKKILNGWFLSRELAADATEGKKLALEEKAAAELEAVIAQLPLEISDNAIFAGTQRDAFAASYALINPAFEVESFKGYCDVLEVYDYAQPDGDVTQERITAMRARAAESDYAKSLAKVYADCDEYTEEVVFFVEQCTGHLIPDFRSALKSGVRHMIADIDTQLQTKMLPDEKKENLRAMRRALQCVVLLAHRYAAIAAQKAVSEKGERVEEWRLMERTLRHVPEFGARSLYEAMQSYLLLWQVMCLEQAPNPFAFSVGNADRIFYPYMKMDGSTREQAAALFKHFLVFYNVGERSWAISQNVLISGRDADGADLTNPMTYAILDAYYGTWRGEAGPAGLRGSRMPGAVNYGEGHREYNQFLVEYG